ncbi:MAG: hypothetical protein V2I36_06085 [Desulfopila sp.]|jgi:hypothetical protein|nr:hypothetical protein [Desulfopila sp.]
MRNIPLILSNVRIRGLGNVIESQWFEVGSSLTFFAVPESFNRQGFLEALQTINPPYNIEKIDPFRNYPTITRQGKFQKRVRPHRRTIAYAIFTAQPLLVEELAEITPHLYEADRIEVGRRFNYSRWVNFVEIAGSSRWSEISREVLSLASENSLLFPASRMDQLNILKETDRVEDDLREYLNAVLLQMLQSESQQKKGKLHELRFAVQRQKHFANARKYVKEQLPLFHLIDSYTFAMPCSQRVAEISRFVEGIVYDFECGGTVPILLVNEPDLSLGEEEKKELRRICKDFSLKCQCFYFLNDSEYDAAAAEESKTLTLADILAREDSVLQVS